MDKEQAREALDQLLDYTTRVSTFVGVEPFQSKRNHNGAFEQGAPFGAINHFTASNLAVTKKRPYGRIPVLLDRFARGGKQGVGVHFIVWDGKVPRFEEIRSRYPALKDMPSEVFFFGDDLAYWHAGWANNSCYGVEIRNVGKLVGHKGAFFWGKGQYRYFGRAPTMVGNSFWEPYSREQIAATIWIHRLMNAIHTIDPVWFLGHVHVSSSRFDPGLHFPLADIRNYSLLQGSDLPVGSIPLLKQFESHNQLDEPSTLLENEKRLHGGLYRNELDGTPDKDEEAEEDKDKEADPGLNTSRMRTILTDLGYFCPPDRFEDVVRIFQARWKKRRTRGRGLTQELKVDGIPGKKTKDKMRKMRDWWRNL